MRGQVHTLEAIVAALLLLTSLIFALQMTAVTPLSASTSSQHIENQLQTSVQGVLASAAENGELKPALLYGEASPDGFDFHKSPNENYYTGSAPPNEFGERLNQSFDQRGIAYNVQLSSDSGEKRYIYRGIPSENAVHASWTVVFFDDDRLYDKSMSQTNTKIGPPPTYFIEDTSEAGTYNVVTVEVIAWRI